MLLKQFNLTIKYLKKYIKKKTDNSRNSLVYHYFSRLRLKERQ